MATFCTFLASDELPADVRFGCELKFLDPASSTPDSDLAIDESLLLGSKFQVWERCLSSVISKLHLADCPPPESPPRAL